ncbi:uncharacterized protein BXZ73DRAFT_92079 [Epithele typhae]|uniref:uncharacterized protein n=1 Tax=Epithele typhae TaxID=378194 RepID=UPI0020083CB3|nr:uncharacterized protein BXZ73DRAFT_92079 [Epithele typhae]KAH9919484.1 hypothetical protein BXZ73DRAFT_92079 [Epithele typhae]
MPCVIILGCLALLGFCALVSAGIYPTTPWTGSSFTAGRIETVRWRDDNTWPALEEMGVVDVRLHIGEISLGILAEHVAPTNFSAEIWISPAWGHNGSDYHLRFVCKEPKVTFYSADFTITGMSTDPPYEGPTIEDHNDTALGVVYITPQPTPVLPRTTTEPSATPSEESLARWKLPLDSPNGAASSGLRTRPTAAVARLQFRILYIFWPTAMGLSMAL